MQTESEMGRLFAFVPKYIKKLNEEKEKKFMIQKERLERKNGITLISLVITIIILLILASVAITLAVDSNGLFNRAGQAANAWNGSVANESEAIENLLTHMNTIVGGGSQGGSGNLPAGWDNTKISAVVEEGSRKAPIPNGYVASDVAGESSIADGLVIYERTEQVSTDEDAMTTRNQYVWIPVDDINSMIMCRTHGAGTVTLDPETLQCPICGEATKLAGKTYDVSETSTTIDGNKIWTYTQDFSQNNQTYSPNSGAREPAVVTGSSDGQGTSYDGSSSNYHGLGTAEAFLSQLEDDFEEMARSVAKYKGFYVSRYEIGAGASSKQGQTVLNAGTNGTDSDYIWYGLYQECRNVTDSAMHSHMIWGSQYDQIMKFAKEKERRDGTGAVFDVFTASVARQKTSQMNAGTNPADKVCNIYDLEGNYLEWTAQADSTNLRVVRGGNCNDASIGSFNPAGNFHGRNPASTYTIYSCRATLYVAL